MIILLQNQKIKLQAKSSLTTHKLHTINITQSEDTEESIFQIIKQEEEYKTPEVPVKEEYDHTFDSEDEKVQKKIKVKRRKRKRKEAEVYKEVDLSREDLEEERRIAMLKEEYVNAMFKCERCIVSFPNAEDLKDHINLKHDLVRYLLEDLLDNLEK